MLILSLQDRHQSDSFGINLVDNAEPCFPHGNIVDGQSCAELGHIKECLLLSCVASFEDWSCIFRTRAFTLCKNCLFCFGDDSHRRDPRHSHPCEDRRDAETAH